MFSNAFFINNSLNLYGLNRSVLSFRSSSCNVFQKELCPSPQSQHILIAVENVKTLWRPLSIVCFWGKYNVLEYYARSCFYYIISFSKLPFTLIKSIIFFSYFLQYILDRVGRTEALWLRTLSMNILTNVSLPKIVKYLCHQSFATISNFRSTSSKLVIINLRLES